MLIKFLPYILESPNSLKNHNKPYPEVIIMIETCKKCGSMMVPEKKTKNIVLKCMKCGHEEKKEIKAFKITEAPKKEKIITIDEDSTELPVTVKMCPKCECTKAYYFLRQTRSADEPPTQFFKCAKCGYSWREY